MLVGQKLGLYCGCGSHFAVKSVSIFSCKWLVGQKWNFFVVRSSQQCNFQTANHPIATTSRKSNLYILLPFVVDVYTNDIKNNILSSNAGKCQYRNAYNYTLNLHSIVNKRGNLGKYKTAKRGQSGWLFISGPHKLLHNCVSLDFPSIVCTCT
jgi:hypothetical protein